LNAITQGLVLEDFILIHCTQFNVKMGTKEYSVMTVLEMELMIIKELDPLLVDCVPLQSAMG